ncbi:MAG: hypothetical protein L6R30_10770 [Thermoanaerobaculia bacterium]|nr:hypothetical protein [Thermoanaerobaculia bacterium]
MTGQRHKFSCASCGKPFTYWVVDGNSHPKPKCYFCGKDFYPNGEPPKEEAAAAAPAVVGAPAAAPEKPA